MVVQLWSGIWVCSVAEEVVDNRLKSDINFANTKNRLKGFRGTEHEQNLISDNIVHCYFICQNLTMGFIRCYSPFSPN